MPLEPKTIQQQKTRIPRSTTSTWNLSKINHSTNGSNQKISQASPSSNSTYETYFHRTVYIADALSTEKKYDDQKGLNSSKLMSCFRQKSPYLQEKKKDKASSQCMATISRTAAFPSTNALLSSCQPNEKDVEKPFVNEIDAYETVSPLSPIPLTTLSNLFKGLIHPMEARIVGYDAIEQLVALLSGMSVLRGSCAAMAYLRSTRLPPILHHKALSCIILQQSPILLGCLSFRNLPGKGQRKASSLLTRSLNNFNEYQKEENKLSDVEQQQQQTVVSPRSQKYIDWSNELNLYGQVENRMVSVGHDFLDEAIMEQQKTYALRKLSPCSWTGGAMQPKDTSWPCGGDDSILIDDVNGLIAVADGVGAWSATGSTPTSADQKRHWNRAGCPVGLFSLEMLARLQRIFAYLEYNDNKYTKSITFNKIHKKKKKNLQTNSKIHHLSRLQPSINPTINEKLSSRLQQQRTNNLQDKYITNNNSVKSFSTTATTTSAGSSSASFIQYYDIASTTLTTPSSEDSEKSYNSVLLNNTTSHNSSSSNLTHRTTSGDTNAFHVENPKIGYQRMYTSRNGRNNNFNNYYYSNNFFASLFHRYRNNTFSNTKLFFGGLPIRASCRFHKERLWLEPDNKNIINLKKVDYDVQKSLSLRNRLCEAGYRSVNHAVSFGGTTLLCVAIPKRKKENEEKKNHIRKIEVVRIGDSELAILRPDNQGSMFLAYKTSSSRRHFNCPSQITRLPGRSQARKLENLLPPDILNSIELLRKICDFKSYVQQKKKLKSILPLRRLSASFLQKRRRKKLWFRAKANSNDSTDDTLRCHRSRGTLIPPFEQFSVPILSGDLLIVGTDGLFDNLFDGELVELVNQIVSIDREMLSLSPSPTAYTSPRRIAEEVCRRAYQKSQAGDSTPFMQAAAQAGFGPLSVGGKPDDISKSIICNMIAADVSMTGKPGETFHQGFQMPVLSSATGFVALLTDSDPGIQETALKSLLKCVDYNWHEISDAMIDIESLALDITFPHRKLAALLAARLAYNLEMGEETLQYAMAAEDAFDIHEVSEFTLTVIAKAVEKYCQDRQKIFDMTAADEMLTDAISVARAPSSNAPLQIRELLPIDPRLESLVERMIDESKTRGMVGEREALGVALESRRLDKVRSIIETCQDKYALLRYCLERSEKLDSRRFRSLLHSLLVEVYDTALLVKDPASILCSHYSDIIQALFLARYDERVAELLYHLLFPEISCGLDETDSVCMAYQCAFDLVSYENQPFMVNLLKHPLLQLPVLPSGPNTTISASEDQSSSSISGRITLSSSNERHQQPNASENDTNGDMAELSSTLSMIPPAGEETMPLLGNDGTSSQSTGQTASSPLKETDLRGDDPGDDTSAPLLPQGDNGMPQLYAEAPVTNEATSPIIIEDISAANISQPQESIEYKKIERLRKILSGQTTLDLAVEFLHRMNKTDLVLLDQIKGSVDPRSSITQNAIVICHALMQAGTTCDSFLRENLDWLGRAVCWAKFTAAASTGLLHKGHIAVSRQVLSAYLPGSGGGSFSEGGALYGLGLIHANLFDGSIKEYLLEQLQSAQTYCPQNYEPLQHGACLGLGLMAMSTGDSDIYGALRDIVFLDSAVSGEAASIGMGLVSLGSGSEDVVLELIGHAQDTEHERIVRGASLGAAFVLYRKEEEADGLLEQMMKHKDPMIRYSGMFAIGLAYCGTSNSSAVRRLLHVGVTDVSGDVRRAAVIALGFVMCNAPHQIPAIVSLLADSFNPHVRYAAALAVGIGCAGSCSQAAVDLLLPMTQDTTDFIRQGALLALGLVLVQASTAALPNGRVRKVRDLMVRIAGDKHEDAITRFGSIIAQGLIDAGGRNSTIGFFSATGQLRPESAVGFTLFSQLWFWHPLVLSVALAFRPTALIGLTHELATPSDFEIRSTAPSAKFAYIEPVSKIKKEEKRETVSAVLSTAHRRRQQEHMKKLNADAARSKTRTGDTDMESAPVLVAEDVAQPADNSTSTEKLPPALQTDLASGVGETNDGNPTVTLQEVVLTVQAEKTSAIILKSPCRVVPGQEEYISLDVPTSSWVPIDSKRRSGIVLLKRKPLVADVEMKVDDTNDLDHNKEVNKSRTVSFLE